MTVQADIEQKLAETLTPAHLEVINESHMHNVPPGSESHFKVTLVTDKFNQVPLIRRHRAVNGSLAGEIQNAIHALALHTLTPDEWFAKGGQVPQSPDCLGGGKNA